MLKLFRNYIFPLVWVYLMACTATLHATHIVGGDMTYRCLGNNLYEISMTLRRDCINGNPAFDNPASVGIFDSLGILQTNLGKTGRLVMVFRPDDTLNEFLRKNCGIIGGDVCVHTTTYKDTLTLPYKKGGYILAYQRCCRNMTIQNIDDPLSIGATYSMTITTEALRTCNSSPKLGEYPPIYVCGDHKIEFDLKAKDAEGDSLVYLMCNPMLGADQMKSMPLTPSAPPYTPITFKAPYTSFDMIGGIPPLNINQNTGLMTGFAVNVVAQYLVAYCVLEYRNGILLSSLRRDFQINVRICNSVPIADFDFTIDPCLFPPVLSLKDKSSDQYSKIDSWSWIADLHSNIQYSNKQNPILTFTDTGIVNVNLVIHSAASCNDTIIKKIAIHSFKPAIDSASHTICRGDSVELVQGFDPTAIYHWIPSAGLSCNRCPNPKASPFKDTRYILEISDGNCIRKDTINVFLNNCVADSCAISIQKTCLPNGMIEIAAYDAYGRLIQPKVRNQELFWSVKQSANYPEVSLINQNPIQITSNRAFTLTSKIYTWKPGLPQSIEFADICKRFLQDSSNIICSGPCAELNFILSSCEDDYDIADNLNFPSAICESICNNACNYIVGLFETNGTLIDPSKYTIKWSVGGNGAYVMMMGAYYNTLAVSVQKGDCIWYGRYWKSCANYPHHLQNDKHDLNFSNSIFIERNRIHELIQNSNSISIYNLEGQLISKNKNQIENLEAGIYFLVIGEGKNRGGYKVIKN